MRIFGVIPLYQATKQHLNNSQTVKNDEKRHGELIKATYLLLVELCCFPVQCLEERTRTTTSFTKPTRAVACT